MSAGRGQGSFGKTIDMLPSTFTPTLSRRDTNKSIGHEVAPGSVPPPLMSGGGVLGPQSAAAIYQHIHDMATKRISTLDYLRKASVRHIFFFLGSQMRMQLADTQCLVMKDVYIGSIPFTTLELILAGSLTSIPENYPDVLSITFFSAYPFHL